MNETWSPKIPPSRTSDGQRVRKHPTKQCVLCRETFPNTDQHFSRGPTSRITSTCISCEPNRQRTLKANAPGECPVCGQDAALVSDRKGPLDGGQPLKVCRRCLLMAGMTEQTDDAGLERLFDWLKWRRMDK